MRWNTWWLGVPLFAALAFAGDGWLNLLWAVSCAGWAVFTEASERLDRHSGSGDVHVPARGLVVELDRVATRRR